MVSGLDDLAASIERVREERSAPHGSKRKRTSSSRAEHREDGARRWPGSTSPAANVR